MTVTFTQAISNLKNFFVQLNPFGGGNQQGQEEGEQVNGGISHHSRLFSFGSSRKRPLERIIDIEQE